MNFPRSAGWECSAAFNDINFNAEAELLFWVLSPSAWGCCGVGEHPASLGAHSPSTRSRCHPGSGLPPFYFVFLLEALFSKAPRCLPHREHLDPPDIPPKRDLEPLPGAGGGTRFLGR